MHKKYTIGECWNQCRGEEGYLGAWPRRQSGTGARGMAGSYPSFYHNAEARGYFGSPRAILTEVIAAHPYEGKKLLGDLAGSYSYRLTYQDRVVYSSDEATKTVYIERARTH